MHGFKIVIEDMDWSDHSEPRRSEKRGNIMLDDIVKLFPDMVMIDNTEQLVSPGEGGTINYRLSTEMYISNTESDFPGHLYIGRFVQGYIRNPDFFNSVYRGYVQFTHPEITQRDIYLEKVKHLLKQHKTPGSGDKATSKRHTYKSEVF